MSIASVEETPNPTAAPLIAAITGFGKSKRRMVIEEVPSIAIGGAESSVGVCAASPGAGLRGPADMSDPAQKARPAPVTITARTSSFTAAASNARCSSAVIRGVWAFSFSGRCNVIVATRSSTS